MERNLHIDLDAGRLVAGFGSSKPPVLAPFQCGIEEEIVFFFLVKKPDAWFRGQATGTFSFTVTFSNDSGSIDFTPQGGVLVLPAGALSALLGQADTATATLTIAITAGSISLSIPSRVDLTR